MLNEIWKYPPTETGIRTLVRMSGENCFNPSLHLDSSKNMMRVKKVEHTR